MIESQTVHVSVVVPCRNEIHHIRAFLNSVFGQELGLIEIEVLIADGMSDDGTREVLAEFERRFPFLRVIDNPEKIVSTAMNRAIPEARGEIIVRMDAHTVYAPNYVRSCVEVLRETNADNVGGPALTLADNYVARAIAFAFHTPFATGGARYRDPSFEGKVDSVPYGCWRKSTLEHIGTFDERLVRGEDYEFNLRLVSGGGTVWQSPKIVSWYWPRAKLSQLFWQYFQYGFWKAGIIQKHRKITSWRNLVPGSCLLAGMLLLLCASAAGLGGSAWWRNIFLAGWLLLTGSYSFVSFAVALSVAKREGWIFLPFLPIVFGAYHLPHALGFLLGMLYRPTNQALPGLMQKAVTTITR